MFILDSCLNRQLIYLFFPSHQDEPSAYAGLFLFLGGGSQGLSPLALMISKRVAFYCNLKSCLFEHAILARGAGDHVNAWFLAHKYIDNVLVAFGDLASDGQVTEFIGVLVCGHVVAPVCLGIFPLLGDKNSTLALTVKMRDKKI